MKKIFMVVVLLLAVMVTGASIAREEENAKKPLDEVFNSAVVIPFDYQGKVFLNGQKTDVRGDYDLYKREGRVLVPVRLMSYLAARLDGNDGYWRVHWGPQKPDSVRLSNQGRGKTVKLKVNSKTMYINDRPSTLDVPPQKIENRIVLPLRSIATALDKNVAWLDGLVIISNQPVDLQSSSTLELKDSIKEKLVDKRKKLDYEKRINPVARYKETIYYTKNKDSAGDRELYKKTGSGPEVKIDLPGKKQFSRGKVFNNELHYIATIDGTSMLYALNLAGNKARKICTLGQWHPRDGWLAGMKYIGGELYIILHTGDLTMGSEKLYKAEDGQLQEITGAKSFISFDIAGEYMYYTEFAPMVNEAGNLFRVNTKTGEKQKWGEESFAYDIFRTVKDNGGTRFSTSNSFYIKGGYIYTLGYKQEDRKDKCSVYRISPGGKSQEKLTAPARDFWLVDDQIYYIDLNTGNLKAANLEGNDTRTLSNREVIEARFFNGNIYYTAGKGSSTGTGPGKLYKYNISGGQESKLSDAPVSEFYAGQAGVYYRAEGYAPGVYKVDASGNSKCLVEDTVDTLLYTRYGVVYTLRYEEGIYSA